MTAKLLSGKEIAEAIKAEVREAAQTLAYRPCLAVVRIGDDAASAVYVGSKIKTARDLGLDSRHFHLPADVSQDDLLRIVGELNDDPQVDGILVQLPLPPQIDETAVIDAVDPEKDVDGFNPVNVGRLSLGRPTLEPCTPAGVIEILKRSGVEIGGRHAVIVGRSNIVGKPMAMLLLRENATVTICHSRTRELASIAKKADILVAAIGRAGFITAEHIREGATVIDVGINSVTDARMLDGLFDAADRDRRAAVIEKRGATLVGDVNPRDAMRLAGRYTPVPGGVGLLTVAMLMKNTVRAAVERRPAER